MSRLITFLISYKKCDEYYTRTLLVKLLKTNSVATCLFKFLQEATVIQKHRPHYCLQQSFNDITASIHEI